MLKKEPSKELAEQLEEVIKQLDRKEAVESVGNNDNILDVCP